MDTYWLQILGVSKVLPLEVCQCKHAIHFHHYEADYWLQMASLAVDKTFLSVISCCTFHSPAKPKKTLDEQ